jgi:hypothetical protein
VAKRYIQWYSELIPTNRAKFDRDRITTVVFTLSQFSVGLNKWSDVATNYEEFSSDHPEYFSPRSIDVWEKALRFSSQYEIQLNDAQATQALKEDGDLKAHWQQFESFLEAFQQVPNMRIYALGKLQVVHNILSV